MARRQQTAGRTLDGGQAASWCPVGRPAPRRDVRVYCDLLLGPGLCFVIEILCWARDCVFLLAELRFKFVGIPRVDFFVNSSRVAFLRECNSVGPAGLPRSCIRDSSVNRVV